MPTKKLTAFLAELEKNNDRDWFAANKARYEADVLEPTLELIRDLQGRLKKISKHFVADDRKVGGSMMRIHRDVRFSKDKRPYNTHLSMIFHHAVGKKEPAPGYYLRLGADQLDVGVGIWHPEGPTLQTLRERIVAKPKDWAAARDDPAFKKTFGALAGDSLKRPPRGFDPDHVHVEDLKRKDYVGFCVLEPSALVKKTFPDDLAARYAAGTKLMRFLCQALALPY